MELIRGDTLKLKFLRKNKNGEVIKTKPDRLYFTVKSSYYAQNCLFQKSLDKDISFSEEDYYYRFTINPKDTDGLEYGNYVYDIETITADTVKTIAKGTLEIKEEVTFAENEV